MARHQLIIGLGGVGGRSIAAFRKAVVTHEKDYKVISEEKGSRFEYLYIDSNDDILGSDIWDVYGRSVRLERSDYVMLKERGGTSSIKEISQQENIAPWIGNLAEHFATRTGKSSNLDDGSLDSELMGLDGAGQLRRYGRVLFALHSQTIRHNLQNKIKNLTHGSDSEIDVRIFCTLGGGTGSGSIVDMVTLIQSLADDSGHKYRTFIYTFVAGHAQDAQDTGSFYQNEYASLRDLNALMVEKYHPYIAGVVGRDISDNYYYKKGNHPIHAIYISSEVSQGNPNLRDQVEFMAKACLDTIMYSMLYKEPDCLKAISGEDLVQVTPGESENPSNTPSSQAPIRSYRFAALGSKRWCVPTEQIKELLKLKYEFRVLNSWGEGSPLPKGAQKRDIGKVSIDFKPRGGKTWEAIGKYCNEAKKRLEDEKKAIEEESKREPDTLKRLNDLSVECADKVAKELLNSTDVRRDLQNCAQEDAADMLAMLRDVVDRQFRWVEGGVDTWGIGNVREYLSEYIRKIPSWERELTGTMTVQDIEDTQKTLHDTMELREKEWEKIGVMTVHLTSKSDRMIDYQFKDCIHRVDLALLPFKRRSLSILIEEAQNQVSSLISHVDAAAQEIKASRTQIENAIGALENDILTDNKSDMSDQFEFDKDNLVQVQREIEKLEDEHATQMARRYSPAWDKVVGSFGNYKRNIVTKLLDSLEGDFYESSERLHNRAIDRNGTLQGVLLSSIIERLIQIAGETPGPNNQNWERNLGNRIESFVGELRCSTFIEGKGGLTSPQSPPCKAVVFGFPKGANAPNGFIKWLERKFNDALPDKYRPLPGRMDYFEHNSDGEIRVLYMPYWFPARFAPVVSKIFVSYKETGKKKEESVKIYFANIDDDDISLHSKTRPTLTKEGDPDKMNIRKVDFATKLYLKRGDQKKPVAKVDDLGIKIIRNIDEYGIAEYSHKTYSLEEKAYPSTTFKIELNSAIDMALKQMDEAEKMAIFNQYTEELQRLEQEGLDAYKDAQAIEAREARNAVKKWLGLSD